MRYLSVCSGIEAATVAWHPLGWIPAAFSEIEAFPRAVLAHHYPGVPLHGDFTTIEGNEYGSIDLLVGGTPCQDFSVAGLRAGIAGDRGNLTLEFLRLASRTQPRWIVWENVPGVLSSDGGRALGAFLGGLAELGYGFAYRVLDAQYFGLAQRRARVFAVGYLGDWRRAAAVLFERESLLGNPAPRREAGQGVAPTISARPSGGGGLGTDFDCDGGLVAGTLQASGKAAGSATQQDAESGLLVAYGQNNTSGPVEISHALQAHAGPAGPAGPAGRLDFGSETFLVKAYRTSGNCGAWPTGDRVDAMTTGTDPNSHVVAFSAKDHGADAGPLSPTLRAGGFSNSHANDGVMPAVAFDLRGREGGAQFEGPHDTANMRAASGGSSRSYVAHTAVRRLTPRECERLQGFPDDYTRIPRRLYKQRKITKTRPADLWERVEGGWMLMAADGPRYKALGNSMAVPVMAWIGQRIAMVEQLIERATA